MKRFGTKFGAFAHESNGAAAAEFAMFVVFLVPLIVNVVDVGAYAFQRMQVENAAQATAQAAWSNCTTKPATVANCPNLSGAVSGAVKGTTLGDAVMITNDIYADAGTFCPDDTTTMLTASTAATCASTGKAPGYYVKVTVSYPFAPMFAGATVASLFATPITKTTWTRIE